MGAIVNANRPMPKRMWRIELDKCLDAIDVIIAKLWYLEDNDTETDDYTKMDFLGQDNTYVSLARNFTAFKDHVLARHNEDIK